MVTKLKKESGGVPADIISGVTWSYIGKRPPVSPQVIVCLHGGCSQYRCNGPGMRDVLLDSTCSTELSIGYVHRWNSHTVSHVPFIDGTRTYLQTRSGTDEHIDELNACRWFRGS